MADWATVGGVAALVSAAVIPLVVALTLSNLALEAAASLKRYLAGWISPWKLECDLLTWDDLVPDGPMHDCAMQPCCHQSWHWIFHTKQECCWNLSFSVVFSRSLKRCKRTVRKPRSLPLNRTYLRTDVCTLQAFVLCASWPPDKKFDHWPMTSGPDHFRSVDTCVRYKKFQGDVLVAHVEGRFGHNLTKLDLRGLLGGAPPWYRHSIRLGNTELRVPHPIRSVEDLSRAGWIAAISIGGETPVITARHDDALLDKSMKRAYDIVRHRLLPRFADDERMRRLTRGLELLSEGKKSHPAARMIAREDMQSFTPEEAIYTMAFFNEHPSKKLTDDDLNRLTPALGLKMVEAVYVGAREALIWYTRRFPDPFRLKLPFEDMDPKRRVFLEDCSREE
jgi:hypothetical protein